MSKRRPIHSTPRMNFRGSENQRGPDIRGMRPTAEPPSVKEIFTLMLLHICKKSIFFDTNLKVALYLGTLFLISLIADFLPVPKTYFARSDNFFNQYFVKFAWGWNLIVLIPFVTLTSLTYCCGNLKRVAKEHLSRILIATIFWYIWTTSFNYIETNFGKCNVRGEQYNSKSNCLKAGFFWHGFDISGHCFILIYGSLVLIEEGRAIIGWETIKENLRNEEHNRNVREPHSTNPLRNLDEIDLFGVKLLYEKFTPYIRGLFVAMTVLQILWDIMLISTMLYYHIMVEKFIGGTIAILLWFVTYRVWYKIDGILPRRPGQGSFKYNRPTTVQTPLQRKASFTTTSSTNNATPKFMGMPIYKNRETTATSSSSENVPASFISLNTVSKNS